MYRLYEGDCLEVMPTLAAGSVDAVICDPPYGLGFMGKDWDHGVPGEHFWREALRVAKPGAHLLAFGGTRTFHRLAVAIEDAGWEIRDTIMWVYGSGFPKSLDVSKAIDKAAGVERVVVGEYVYPDGKARNFTSHSTQRNGIHSDIKTDGSPNDRRISEPGSPEAQQWDGWGTALKPAWEPIIVARKPAEGTVAENVQKYGTGGINIDGCRVPINGDMSNSRISKEQDADKGYSGGWRAIPGRGWDGIDGRWPANLIHDGSEEVTALFPVTTSGTLKPGGVRPVGVAMGGHPSERTGEWDSSTGSAARFFYTAKASKEDREDGCGGLEERQQDEGRRDGDPGGDNPRNRGVQRRANHHPTVKPLDLMRYLCRLVTPLGGVVLDPFMGSGSTGRAAVLEGFGFVGIDLESAYVAIAQARIAKAGQMADGGFGEKRGRERDWEGLPLFGVGEGEEV